MLRRPKLSKIEVVAPKEEERKSCFFSLLDDGFKVKS